MIYLKLVFKNIFIGLAYALALYIFFMCMIVILMGGNFWGINFFHNGEGLLNIILPFLGY